MEILYWHWIVLGLILVISEILTPGFFFMWMGLGSLVTGFVAYFFSGMPFAATGTLFVLFSIVFCYFGRIFYKKSSREIHKSTLNQRGNQYIGQKFTVEEGTVNGVGKVKVGDSVWPFRSSKEYKAGDTVEIKGVDGITLLAD